MAELSKNALAVLERRYLNRNEQGEIIETVEDMFERVAKAVAEADYLYGAADEEVVRTKEKFFRMMTSLDFLPNSPTLMNAGLPLGQLSACFVLPIPDTMEGIFEAVKNTALIHKSGGGTGFSFNRLRPKGAVVHSTGGGASGPVSFMKVFNAATEAVKQGGKRRGANMGILRVDHPDILEFIRSKEKNNELTNFNISVGITEAFMEAVEENREYRLVDPVTQKPTGSLNAREVFDLIVSKAWLNGEPGIIFLDRINAKNPLPQRGEIESTNPCGEQPLLSFESCNLGSINLVHMLHSGSQQIDYEKLKETVQLAVHFLDNVIDINAYPIPEIAEKSRESRKIGLGVMGFADLLIRMGIPYDSEEAVKVASDVMSFIDRCAKEASGELAGKKGVFALYQGSVWEKSNMPLRNATTTTIAPTGTISMIAGCTSGIEPLFAVAYYKQCMDNDRLPEIHPYFEELAGERGFFSRELMDQITKGGNLAGIKEVPLDIQRIFVTAHDISPYWQIRIQAAFQQFTDNAVSKTINFPHDARPEDIKEAYLLAYKLGCKGVTVYRDRSREDQVLNLNQEEIKENKEMKSKSLGIAPRYRPEITQGLTEKAIAGCGNLYITVNFDQTGICEVFTNLGKGGGCPSQTEATSRLISLALRSGIRTTDIVEQLKGIRCPATLARKSKVEKIRVLSCPDAIARTLEKVLDIAHNGENNGYHLSDVAEEIENYYRNPDDFDDLLSRCPECGGKMEHDGGCALCRSCGYSKCG